jgi:signal peptidase I
VSAATAGEKTGGGSLLEWAKSIAFAVVAWLLLSTFLIKAFRITSGSMENTLLVGDVLWVWRPVFGIPIPFTPWRIPGYRRPHHGDIVVFESVEAATPGLEIVKRVIGVAGDTLEMRGGTVYRNGTPLDEPYVVRQLDAVPNPTMQAALRRWQEPRLLGPHPESYAPDRNNWGPVQVPPDSIFVMGDNRDDSWDGRAWGFLPLTHVHGEPVLIYYSWNPNSWRPVPLLTATRWSRLLTVPR